METRRARRVDRLEGAAARLIPPAVRITAGMLWLTNLAWKVPPTFGEESGRGLYAFTRIGVEHPILPPYTWLLENVILPNFALFGWAVLISETAVAASLLSGTFTRAGAILGAAQGAVIGLTVGRGPEEWGWGYILLIAVHLAILALPGATRWSVDAVLARRKTDAFGGALRAGRAGLAAAIGGYGVLVIVLALDEPFLDSGTTVGGVAGVQGSAALGALLVLVGMVTFAAAGRPVALPTALVLLALAAAAVALYGSEVSVLSAGPTTAVVLAVGAAFLLTSVPRRR